ncbi:hypothetical protein FZC84_19220 [Rossellomorea vietnamensis]|uniref:Uncharacterized protein n=1 Tax=Rossellomorea vietnamensis TaxID=218284 RepID=A0A5D4M6I2_9BACI|nr:hypothetical protein [Rossellomorea vietnamensis]TYR97509.1 hypothetical protein FZC84_19220 [Rossellomorea vietnamensis]
MTHKNNKLIYPLILSLIVILSGCNDNEKSVYLSLTGESKTWKLTGYEMEISPESFKAGNGTLIMKDAEEYNSDSIYFEAHAIINGKDFKVHTGSEAGTGIDIAENSTGSIEGGEYVNEAGRPITFNEVSNIYVVVEWRNMDKGESIKENIPLYTNSSKEDSF